MLTPDHALRHRPFRWLLGGVAVNSLGNGVAPVALAFAVLDLGGDATDLGTVVGLYAAAEVVAVLAGGVVGDRLPRRTVMVLTMIGATLAQAVAGLSLVTGRSSLPLLAVAGMGIAVLGALGGPSSSAMTGQTVPAAALAQAVAWRRLAQNAGVVVGAGLAGVLVVAAGTGWALLLDAVTFAVAAACFTRLRVPALPAPESAGVLRDVGAGLREVLRHTWLWVLVLQALLYHLFYGGAQGVLGPIVVGDALGRAAWGWAIAAMMVGFVCGGLLTVRWRPGRPLLVGTCFLALTAAFPIAMAWPDAGLLAVLAGAWLHGFGLEIFSVGWDLSIQENVPVDRLARVYAFDQLGSFVARPVGLALTGPVSVALGERTWLLVVGGVILASVATALTIPDVRALRRRTISGELPDTREPMTTTDR